MSPRHGHHLSWFPRVTADSHAGLHGLLAIRLSHKCPAWSSPGGNSHRKQTVPSVPPEPTWPGSDEARPRGPSRTPASRLPQIPGPRLGALLTALGARSVYLGYAPSVLTRALRATPGLDARWGHAHPRASPAHAWVAPPGQEDRAQVSPGTATFTHRWRCLQCLFPGEPGSPASLSAGDGCAPAARPP